MGMLRDRDANYFLGAHTIVAPMLLREVVRGGAPERRSRNTALNCLINITYQHKTPSTARLRVEVFVLERGSGQAITKKRFFFFLFFVFW